MVVKAIRMTEAEFQEMLSAQGGKCLLCRKAQRKQRLTRDHDHETGRIRGLLCLRCNRALGAFEWSDEVLVRLRVYIAAILKDRVQHRIEEN